MVCLFCIWKDLGFAVFVYQIYKTLYNSDSVYIEYRIHACT